MVRVSVFDFTGSPPSQGGQADYIPPGRYLVEVHEMVDTTSKAGNRMVTNTVDVIEPVEFAGSRLIDYFTLNELGSVGYKRLHACMLALGVPVSEKAVKVNLDGRTGTRVEIQVKDRLNKATEEYEESTSSNIVGYFAVGDKAPAAAAKAPAAPRATARVAAAPKAPEPEPEPETAEDEDDEGFL